MKNAAPLLPYQQRWMDDDSRFKWWGASVQTGKSHTISLRTIMKRLRRKGLSILLSASDRQSIELMQKVKMHCQAMDVAAKTSEGFFEQTSIVQHSAEFPNHSRIIALPANPDTARGYSGDVVLDEFSMHRDSREIWAAMFTRATRGFDIEVVSSFKGTNNKFYELAKMLGMVAPYEGWRPPANPVKVNGWSGHWTDIHLAVAEGLKLNVAELRQALGDEEVFLQEYCCIPMADGSEYITLAQILACESTEATAEWDGKPRPGLSAGFDVGRTRDLSVIAIGEPVGPLAIVRGLILMPRMKFSDQKKICQDVARVVEESGGRFSMDATGIGTQLGEELSGEFTCVEPVNFASAVETDAKTEKGDPIKEPVKQRLGGLLKRRFEEQMIWIPEMPALRRSIQAVKRFIGPTGAVRLDAVRTDQGHADEFWALALMCAALEGPGRSYQPASDEDLVGETVAGNVMAEVF